jgi:hypothetical protein
MRRDRFEKEDVLTRLAIFLSKLAIVEFVGVVDSEPVYVPSIFVLVALDVSK